MLVLTIGGGEVSRHRRGQAARSRIAIDRRADELQCPSSLQDDLSALVGKICSVENDPIVTADKIYQHDRYLSHPRRC